MRNRNIVFIVIFIVLVLALVLGLSFTGRVVSEEVIKIGGAFSLSGMAAEWGELDRNGVMLAIEEANENGGINGKKVELIIEDTLSDGAKTVSTVQKLISVDQVDAIIGPTWLDTFAGAASLADESDILVITPSASIDAVESEINYRNVFSTWYRTDIEAKALAKHLANTGKTRVVLFFGNDPYWQDVKPNFEKAAAEEGIEIVKDFKFTFSEKDFRTPLIQTKELNPDAIFFGVNDEAGFLSLLKQKQEIYPDAQFYTTEYVEGLINKESFDGILDGVDFVSPAAVNEDFAMKYKKRFNSEPIFSASTSYDATKILLEAIEETDSTDASVLRDYLNENEFDTITFGNTRFDDIGGVTGGKFVIKSIDGGEVSVIAEIE